MTIRYFLFVNLPLFFSFWTLRPWATLAVALFVELFEAAVANASDGCGVDPLTQFWSALLAALAAAAGWMLAAAIEKPPVLLERVTVRYAVTAGLGVALWILTNLAWQLFDLVWWNVFMLVALAQAILIVLSWLFVPHDRAWGTRGNTHVAHAWFFVQDVVCCCLPMAIAAVADPSFDQLYAAVISASASAAVGAVAWFALRSAAPMTVLVVPGSVLHEDDYDGGEQGLALAAHVEAAPAGDGSTTTLVAAVGGEPETALRPERASEGQ